MQLVWLKRDLRTQDHAPLAAAQASGQPYRVIFIFEPSLMSHPDCSQRHLRFQWQSILDMQSRWAGVGRTVDVFWGEADAVFGWLMEKFSVSKVLSYQESGIQKTFTRDQAMHKMFASRRVQWTEFERNGVFRGIKDRVAWDKRWFEVMSRPVIVNDYQQATDSQREVLSHPFAPPLEMIQDWNAPAPGMQVGGETLARQYLQVLDRAPQDLSLSYFKTVAQ